MLSDSAHADTGKLFAMARADGAVISFDPNVRHAPGNPRRHDAALVVGAVTDLEGLPSRAEHERLMRSAHSETVDR